MCWCAPDPKGGNVRRKFTLGSCNMCKGKDKKSTGVVTTTGLIAGQKCKRQRASSICDDSNSKIFKKCFVDVPFDLAVHILSFVESNEDISRLSRVCKSFHAAATQSGKLIRHVLHSGVAAQHTPQTFGPYHRGLITKLRLGQFRQILDSLRGPYGANNLTALDLSGLFKSDATFPELFCHTPNLSRLRLGWASLEIFRTAIAELERFRVPIYDIYIDGVPEFVMCVTLMVYITSLPLRFFNACERWHITKLENPHQKDCGIVNFGANVCRTLEHVNCFRGVAIFGSQHLPRLKFLKASKISYAGEKQMLHTPNLHELHTMDRQVLLIINPTDAVVLRRVALWHACVLTDSFPEFRFLRLLSNLAHLMICSSTTRQLRLCDRDPPQDGETWLKLPNLKSLCWKWHHTDASQYLLEIDHATVERVCASAHSPHIDGIHEPHATLSVALSPRSQQCKISIVGFRRLKCVQDSSRNFESVSFGSSRPIAITQGLQRFPLSYPSLYQTLSGLAQTMPHLQTVLLFSEHLSDSVLGSSVRGRYSVKLEHDTLQCLHILSYKLHRNERQYLNVEEGKPAQLVVKLRTPALKRLLIERCAVQFQCSTYPQLQEIVIWETTGIVHRPRDLIERPKTASRVCRKAMVFDRQLAPGLLSLCLSFCLPLTTSRVTVTGLPYLRDLYLDSHELLVLPPALKLKQIKLEDLPALENVQLSPCIARHAAIKATGTPVLADFDTLRVNNSSSDCRNKAFLIGQEVPNAVTHERRRACQMHKHRLESLLSEKRWDGRDDRDSEDEGISHLYMGHGQWEEEDSDDGVEQHTQSDDLSMDEASDNDDVTDETESDQEQTKSSADRDSVARNEAVVGAAHNEEMMALSLGGDLCNMLMWKSVARSMGSSH
eukprot:Colp12_sorted_trinity150504_noHs@32396